MPASKKSKSPVVTSQPEEKKYPTEKLLKSRHLAGYQPDFARVILTEPKYSITGAKAALDRAMKGGR